MKADVRKVNYLRISITDRCNFRCRYCVPREPSMLVRHNQIATYEEILHIVQQSLALGINKVRITGGEPFVRKGILHFLEKLCRITALSDVSVTTNGYFLDTDTIQQLLNIGVKRLNISLDTLKRERFEYITGRDGFDLVMENILNAHALGISPLKINTVILRHINDDEIQDLAALSIKYPFHVRFIEYMPMGNTLIEDGQKVLAPEIKERIQSLGKLIPVLKGPNDGPADRYKLENAKGEIGFITPVSNHFCHECNRLRLTATGGLRPCLLRDDEKDILTPLRHGASGKALQEIIRDAVKSKPASHNLCDVRRHDITTQMNAIGG